MLDELARMEPVAVKNVWSHEARVFTPWLAENIGLLADAVGLDLEVTGTEVTTPDGRKADIMAKCGDRKVVIENQLETSDYGHFVRLLYYAASLEAQTLIWVAPAFERIHRENIAWLSREYKLDAHCVELSAWRIGDAIAPMLRRIVPGERVDPQAVEGTRFDRRYREFYSPLLSSLKEAGFDHTTEPGWEVYSNFLWFKTPYDWVHYGLVHADEGDGKTHLFLLFNSSFPDPRYEELRGNFGDTLPQQLEWNTDEDVGDSWVGLSADAADADLEYPEATRQWMFDNLVLLRITLGPHLEKLSG